MVKVLREHPWWRFNCPNCLSHLEASPTDVEYAWFGANWGGESPEKRFYVSCPICGENNFVPNDKLTNAIEQQATQYNPKKSR